MSAKIITLCVDAGVSLPGEADLQIAADVFVPDAAIYPHPALVWVCLPGGGMTRQYFDLPIDESFSFARQMAARGFIVVLIDHLGIGDSSRPADGYALTADVVTAANANATAEILTRLRKGRLSPDVPALPQLRSIGLGHSMGAMMTTLQQAKYEQHIGVALLGFSTRGLPEYLPSSAKAIAHDLVAARVQSPQLAKLMFGSQPYPVIKPTPQSGAIYSGKGADRRGAAAIKAVADALLPVLAFQSMLPGNVLPEAQQIQVPMFLGLGENDMTGPPQEVPASFSASSDVTLYVMPGAGHSHFLFPIRLELFDRLTDWAQSHLNIHQ